MSLDSMADILHCMEQEGKEFWEVVLAADMEERQVSRESSLAKMLTTWQAMVDASDSYTGDRRSVSGLVGYVASGIGAVIAYRACIAGAAGGCQAEIGTASAMAAGALVALRGGSGQQICHAVAMALKNLLGLICDPVAGLVEVPCVKRNVIGAVNAVSAADMALAGIESRIPVDEVIDTMGEVGRRIPVEFRETALGGLADTPTGKAIEAKMRG